MTIWAVMSRQYNVIIRTVESPSPPYVSESLEARRYEEVPQHIRELYERYR